MKIEVIREKAIPILRQAGVQRASVFGSTIKDAAQPRDIDMLVELSKQATLLNFINLKNRLETELGEKVDLVEYAALKPALKSQVIEEKVDLM